MAWSKKKKRRTQIQFSSVQSLSRVWLFATPWIAACQASLSITNSWSSLKPNVHWVGDAIQPSHSLLSPSPPAPNSSQHHSLFQWVSSSHQVAKVLELGLQHQNTQDWSPLGWTGWISLQSQGLSRLFFNTTVFTSIYTGICTGIFCFPKVHIMPLHF